MFNEVEVNLGFTKPTIGGLFFMERLPEICSLRRIGRHAVAPAKAASNMLGECNKMGKI